MKKIYFIFITLVTLSLSIGSYGIFLLFLNQYHVSIKKDIEQNKVNVTDTIYINPSELYNDSKLLQWEDDNNEVYYKGNLFDIVKINHQNTKIQILVISDKKEMDFKMSFAQQQEINKNSNSPLKLLKQFLNLKFVTVSEFECIENKSHFSDDDNCFQSPANNPLKGYYRLDYTPPIYRLI